VSVNVEAILIGLLSTTHTPEQAEHAAREVLRQHAHELAEQVREVAREREVAIGGNYEISELMKAEGMHTAANMIDPEVTREGDDERE